MIVYDCPSVGLNVWHCSFEACVEVIGPDLTSRGLHFTESGETDQMFKMQGIRFDPLASSVRIYMRSQRGSLGRAYMHTPTGYWVANADIVGNGETLVVLPILLPTHRH